MTYQDKNGNEIHADDIIRHDSGEIERVYACGDDDLGINASTKKYLEQNGESARECYPLSQFRMSEWEIMKTTDWYCGNCKHLKTSDDEDSTEGTCKKFNKEVIFYDWYNRCEECLKKYQREEDASND